ncbi:hypothetical protein NDU88_001664 [Pleurodeles waltl]|uniref:Uncharacterized protein n=1 Tax=Pleurodeles waltl TaxID=8319 RepID=A0AAV7RBJ0_PLEWA|nr:hypothetical protein NDU88_001664 [Pleurodeles waltl]
MGVEPTQLWTLAVQRLGSGPLAEVPLAVERSRSPVIGGREVEWLLCNVDCDPCLVLKTSGATVPAWTKRALPWCPQGTSKHSLPLSEPEERGTPISCALTAAIQVIGPRDHYRKGRELGVQCLCGLPTSRGEAEKRKGAAPQALKMRSAHGSLAEPATARKTEQRLPAEAYPSGRLLHEVPEPKDSFPLCHMWLSVSSCTARVFLQAGKPNVVSLPTWKVCEFSYTHSYSVQAPLPSSSIHRNTRGKGILDGVPFLLSHFSTALPVTDAQEHCILSWLR